MFVSYLEKQLAQHPSVQDVAVRGVLVPGVGQVGLVPVGYLLLGRVADSGWESPDPTLRKICRFVYPPPPNPRERYGSGFIPLQNMYNDPNPPQKTDPT